MGREEMKADVYRNLHKKCMSIRSREKSDYGRVRAHAQSLIMQKCNFVVREKGRQRVILEKRKNVHAFVRGKLIQIYVNPTLPLDEFVEVTYNPYHSGSFYIKSTGQPICYADSVIIRKNKVFALQPK